MKYHIQTFVLACSIGALSCGNEPAFAHHSYAMFDMNKPMALRGSVAKLEWTNPHISLWLYVPRPGEAGQYDLWRFQSDPVNIARRRGWTKDVLKIGEKIVMNYFPLHGGERGGYLISILRENGTTLLGDPDAPGVARELAKSGRLPKKESQ